MTTRTFKADQLFVRICAHWLSNAPGQTQSRRGDSIQISAGRVQIAAEVGAKLDVA